MTTGRKQLDTSSPPVAQAARDGRMGTPRARLFEPLTVETRDLLTTVSGHRLQALFELALLTGVRKGELLGLAGRTST